MNIEQVLAMPIGQQFGGFDITIKTCKKKWQVKDKWVQQVIVSDESGDALADVNLGKYIYLRGATLHIIVGMVQAGGDIKKKLLIDEFTIQTDTGEPSQDLSLFEKVARGKTKCRLTCAFIIAKREIDKSEIDKLVDYIFD